MGIFNNLFSVGDKVLKKNMANELCKAKMKMKWKTPCTIVEVTVVGDINSRTNMHIFQNHIAPQERSGSTAMECLKQLIKTPFPMDMPVQG